jgi:hypothetical protein
MSTEMQPEQSMLWDEDDSAEPDDYQVTEYDLTASPNDFNISTLFNFIESGAVKVPGFQRNYCEVGL